MLNHDIYNPSIEKIENSSIFQHLDERWQGQRSWEAREEIVGGEAKTLEDNGYKELREDARTKA